MAQRINPQGFRQGVPAKGRTQSGKPAKAPIDQFFDAVHGMKNPIKGVSVKAPKAPKPARVGPYTKGYKPPALPQPPKPTAAQARAAFERTSVSPVVHQRLAQLAVQGGGSIDKQGRIHWAPLPEQSANTLSLGGLVDRVSRLAIGPNITNAVEGKSFNPWLAPVEAASVFPFGRAARVIGAAADVGRAARAETGIRALDVGGLTVHAPASRAVIPKTIEHVLDRNVGRVIGKGAAEGLHPQQALEAKGVAAKVARTHVSRLRKTEKFYAAVGDQANAKMLANAKLTDPEKLALRAVARGVMPKVTIAKNLQRIAAASKRGDTAAVERLQTENKLLPLAERYVHEVPVEQADKTRFPTHPEHTGMKVVLRPGTDRSSHLLNEFWDQMVLEGGKAERAQIRMGELTPEQAAARVHAPGRIDLGASWRPGEEILPKGLRAQKQRVESLQAAVNKSEATDKARVAKGSLPNQPITKGSTRTLNLRRALNVAEDRLAAMEKAHVTRTGKNPADYYGVTAGLRGAEEFKGGSLYYPSAKEIAAAKAPRQTYVTRSDLLPYAPKGETSKPLTGVLQESGHESWQIPQLVGARAITRATREATLNDLAQLRRVALRGTVPVDAHGQLAKGWQAIRLTSKDIPAHIMDNWRALSSRLDTSVELSHEDAQQLSQSLQELKDWHLPKSFDLGDENIGFVSKALTSALKDNRVYMPEELQRLSKLASSLSQLTKDLLVYTKFPGHIPPRLMSNTLMALPDTGPDFARGLLAEAKLAKQRPDLSRWVTQLGGAGYFKGYTTTVGRVAKPVEKLSEKLIKPIEFAADRGPRNATVLAMAMKQGNVRDFKGLVRYLEQLRAADPGTPAALARQMIVHNARQAAGEYERMGPIGAHLANYIFLLRWIKASTVWTGRFAVRHPLMAAGVGAATYRYGYQAANPIWSRFTIGGHNFQTSLPWSTPVEEAERAATLGQAKPPALGGGLLDIANPFWLTVGGMMAHRDLQTGRDIRGNPVLGALEAYGRSTPPGALLFGKAPLDQRILKMLAGNEATTATGPAPKGVSSADLRDLEREGKITAEQYRQIMQAIKNAPKLEADLRRKVRQVQRQRGGRPVASITRPGGGRVVAPIAPRR